MITRKTWKEKQQTTISDQNHLLPLMRAIRLHCTKPMQQRPVTYQKDTYSGYLTHNTDIALVLDYHSNSDRQYLTFAWHGSVPLLLPRRFPLPFCGVEAATSTVTAT